MGEIIREGNIVCTGKTVVDMGILDYDILTAMREHDIELTKKNFDKCVDFVNGEFTYNYVDDLIYEIVDMQMDDYYDDEDDDED